MQVAILPIASYQALRIIIRNLSIIDSILEGKRQSIYVLQSSFGTVVNSMDIGFAAQVINSSTDSALKRILNKIKLGKLTYLFFSIKTLFSKQSINI
jgi:hypothetical protein